MKYLFSVVLAIVFFAAVSAAQDLNLAISYLYGEKSKDSHSTEESYALSNSSMAYTVKYTGKKGKNQQDMEKTCTFTEQDLKNIAKTIEAKGLNVNDSLFQESSKTKSFEIYTRINIAINMDGQEYKINISGDTKEFDDAALYKNSVFFITMLRKMVEDCK
ncbi:MAG TPA: hypothetical protein PKE39_16085 [Ignavibacteria bacterium]|nr:hypothetical protein [Ignavibacteria bacterium]HMR00544.1 hypothetical protein [Ignavibacteria bacterium]